MHDYIRVFIAGDLDTIRTLKFLFVNLHNFIRSSSVKVVDIAILKYHLYFRGSFCLLRKWHSLRFPMPKCI